MLSRMSEQKALHALVKGETISTSIYVFYIFLLITTRLLPNKVQKLLLTIVFC